MRMPIAVVVGTTGLLTATLAFGALSKEDIKHLNKATTVLGEFRNSSDISESVWSKAALRARDSVVEKGGVHRWRRVRLRRHELPAIERHVGRPHLHATDERQRGFPGRRAID